MICPSPIYSPTWVQLFRLDTDLMYFCRMYFLYRGFTLDFQFSVSCCHHHTDSGESDRQCHEHSFFHYNPCYFLQLQFSDDVRNYNTYDNTSPQISPNISKNSGSWIPDYIVLQGSMVNAIIPIVFLHIRLRRRFAGCRKAEIHL